MKSLLRKENPKDHQQVSNVIKKAFEAEEMSDHKEQLIVDRLIKSKAFTPELSIVVDFNGEIIGHILSIKISQIRFLG